MTIRTNRIEEIFQDARELQADALEMLALGRIRNAAEKAWGQPSGLRSPWCWPGPARSTSGLMERAQHSAGWRPWTKPCGKPACCAGTTAGSPHSTGKASTIASATPSRTRSGGSGRLPTTSRTPSAWPEWIHSAGLPDRTFPRPSVPRETLLTDSRRGTPAPLPRYTPLHADHPAPGTLPLPLLLPNEAQRRKMHIAFVTTYGTSAPAGHPGWRSRALNERQTEQARRMVEARKSLRFVAGDLEVSRDALRRALRESY